MIRSCLYLLLLLLLSGQSAYANVDETILLHCVGFQEGPDRTKYGTAKKLLIAADGSWIRIAGEKVRKDRSASTAKEWSYIAANQDGVARDVIFMPETMEAVEFDLQLSNGRANTRIMSCIETSSPFNH